MKLHFLQCGTIQTKRHLIEGGPIGEEPFEVPVPFFLIEHEGSRILFDVGYAYATIQSPDTGDFISTMTASDYVISQLATLGLCVDDVTHIVLSHLHADHAGGIEAFQGIPCYLQEAEWQSAGGSNLADRYPLDWQLVKGDYDLFGDGRIQLLSTPGHSAGHQSMRLKYDSGAKILLAVDAAYTEAAFKHRSLPVTTFDPVAAMQSFDKINKLIGEGVHVFYGHDPKQCQRIFLTKINNKQYSKIRGKCN
jgi:glyoxylase-like metal-dependent hydrolase (beta-lactamase superfamily II)